MQIINYNTNYFISSFKFMRIKMIYLFKVSKLLNSVNLIRGVANFCIRFPTNLIRYRIRIILGLYFFLLKRSSNLISIFKKPCSLSIWFIICECTLIICSVRKYPFRHFLFSILPKSK